MFAVGFHRCNRDSQMRWKKGTLFDGVLDFQRVLYGLHRKCIPMESLKSKADQFVLNGDLPIEMARSIIQIIEQERGRTRLVNPGGSAAEGGERNCVSETLTLEEMQAELDKRIEMMKAGAAGTGVTDQYRVFDEIIQCLQNGRYLRLMVQASAGTGNAISFH